MFVFIVIFLLFLGSIPLIRTIRRRDRLNEDERSRRYRRSVFVLTGVVAAVIIFAVIARFLTELYWFEDLGFSDRYLSVFLLRLLLFAAGTAVTFGIVYFNMRRHFTVTSIKKAGLAAFLVAFPLSLIFGIWTQGGWEQVLFFVNRAQTEAVDPILSAPTSFYLFSLPFLTWLLSRLMTLAAIIIAVVFFSFLMIRQRSTSASGEPGFDTRRVLSHLLAVGGVLFILIGLNNLLGIPRLLTNTTGIISGVTYIDDNLRIPVLYITAGLYFLGAVLLFAASASAGFARRLFGLDRNRGQALFPITKRGVVFPVLFFGFIIVAKLIVPGLVTAVVVKPNELQVEKPYIDHHIALTQDAYKMSGTNVQRNRFSAGTNITSDILEGNRDTLENVRLWDWRALTSNLKEQQEIRLYYQFEDVDVDRYTVEGDYTQMMVAGRELEKEELAEKSKTWVSEKLKYTHGYGIVMLPAHQYQKQGNPRLLIKNIPSEVDIDSLSVNRPQIYYGERTNDHVYVNTEEEEFDYPGEEDSEYTQYEAERGVTLDTFFREILYAWRFDGHRLLFSRYITGDSKILYRRNIVERVERLIPFLRFDKDPYIVLGDDGELSYILDGYTVTSEYPYAEPYNGNMQNYRGINYIRNSVKVTVDAYDGSVHLYVIDESDPLIRTYRNAFPDLFEPFSEMPEDLKKHIRYPEEYFTIQARMYATYHMEDTAIFYQKEDVWEFSTERYRDNFQVIEPYYVMVEFPGEEGIEFILMLPYTPKNKNVMNAWIAGRCDIPNYGELVVYTIPKGTELLGPRQIEARIDQDTEISRAMTLWGQRGSEVLRGNLLAIPLFNEDELYILYVEPIYIQAENANLPQIKRVAVADQDKVAWAEMFNDSLARLTGQPVRGLEGPAGEAPEAAAAEGVPQEPAEGTGAPLEPGMVAVDAETFEELTQLLEEYKSAAGAGNYAEAGEKLEQVEDLIEGAEKLNTSR
jgi:hypothetical protein